jgi:hypothetical protein
MGAPHYSLRFHSTFGIQHSTFGRFGEDWMIAFDTNVPSQLGAPKRAVVSIQSKP